MMEFHEDAAYKSRVEDERLEHMTTAFQVAPGYA